MAVRISPALEDYLESIFILRRSGQVPRVKNIASLLSVKAPSVIGALASLQNKGLILHERYGYVSLTRLGQEKARRLYEKHTALKKFFHQVLRVEQNVAEKDACRIEHYLSPRTVERMLSFVRFMESFEHGAPHWLGDFHDYVKKNHGKRNRRTKQQKAAIHDTVEQH